ncbi:hypothetical protein [Fodinicurvata fenggangensis]|uniref:hypothetical protein n=1 Tax=Fodinicurvata fenggangensis TaxID=1121830 RepID=UPI00047CAA6E|nr:hypothetical protein [Fodinicurvata fenggangensis]
MTIETFPARGPQRHEVLCQALRAMKPEDVPDLPANVAAMEAALPDATAEEMQDALRQIGDEHAAEAEALRAEAERRNSTTRNHPDG